MAEIFSAMSNGVDVPTLVLDQAPAAPTLGEKFFDESGVQYVPFTCPTTDHDGTALTPNGSGSSGCDKAYLCAAAYNADGSNPLDTISAADAVASYGIHSQAAAPGLSFNAPLAGIPSLPGGGVVRVVGVVSDGSIV